MAVCAVCGILLAVSFLAFNFAFRNRRFVEHIRYTIFIMSVVCCTSLFFAYLLFFDTCNFNNVSLMGSWTFIQFLRADVIFMSRYWTSQWHVENQINHLFGFYNRKYTTRLLEKLLAMNTSKTWVDSHLVFSGARILAKSVYFSLKG